MIVTYQDFNGGNTNIPNLDEVHTNLTTNYINVYEPKFLKELMGDDLYAAYLADQEGVRFVALLPYLKPAIIRYVYRYYVKNNGGTFLAGTGASKSKKQNNTTESAWPLIVEAWNQMVEFNNETNKFLTNNATYPEYKKPTWYGNDWFWREDCHKPEIYSVLNGLGL
jgi:hypothetical protein